MTPRAAVGYDLLAQARPHSLSAQCMTGFLPLYLDAVSGRRQGLAAALVRAGLCGCVPFYAGALLLRNLRYSLQPGSVRHLAAPVISVGNLTTGGTGKTPTVDWIVQRLAEKGHRPAILSRGYHSISEGENDEKRLLDRLCPGAIHIQRADRVSAGRQALAQGADVLVLDDGFQHRRLHRDLDIVLIDAVNPWGFDHLLPRGLLREPKSALRRAGLVLITRCELRTETDLAKLRAEIRQSTPAEIIETAFAPRELISLSGETKPVEELGRRHAMAFCGIGNPDAFRKTLLNLGCAAGEGLTAFPDHHHYTSGELTHLGDLAQQAGAEMLITTEKDLVKIHSPTLRGIPVWAVRIGLTFRGDAEARFLSFLDRAAAGVERLS